VECETFGETEARLQREKLQVELPRLRAELFRAILAALTPPLFEYPDAQYLGTHGKTTIAARVRLAWEYVYEAYPMQVVPR
jgi:hypothetical protein